MVTDPTIPDTEVPHPIIPEKDSGFPVKYIVAVIGGVVGVVVLVLVVCVVVSRKEGYLLQKVAGGFYEQFSIIYFIAQCKGEMRSPQSEFSIVKHMIHCLISHGLQQQLVSKPAG